jgi:hypothetical protein
MRVVYQEDIQDIISECVSHFMTNDGQFKYYIAIDVEHYSVCALELPIDDNPDDYSDYDLFYLFETSDFNKPRGSVGYDLIVQQIYSANKNNLMSWLDSYEVRENEEIQ